MAWGPEKMDILLFPGLSPPSLAILPLMPRTARASAANWIYHVLNRGSARAEVFHKEEDYAAFVRIMALACERLPLRVLGYCLMPNHFHLMLWPRHDGALSRWMQWLMTCHVRRYHNITGVHKNLLARSDFARRKAVGELEIKAALNRAADHSNSSATAMEKPGRCGSPEIVCRLV